MSDSSNNPGSDTSSRTEQARREMVLGCFEATWRNGKRPQLADFLDQVAEPERVELIRELVRLDADYRRKVGETPKASDYAALLQEHQTANLDLLSAELATTLLARPIPLDATSGETEIAPAPSQENAMAAERGVAVESSAGVIGNYEILGEIARGGMGVVYKARHVKLGRIAALKLIKSGELADEEQVRRFQVEAQAAAELDHPGIVPVFEVGQQGNQHFLAMAYVDGQSLWQQVKKAPLPPKLAAHLMRQVAEAIHYAHEKGIVHRDLKPHNILLTKDGQPKVTDFGLAKRQSGDCSLTATGEILGTPSYMPPEQVSGKKDVGPPADIYSLGATLYCLLTGRPPFQAATPLDTMFQVLDRDPVSPKSLNRAVAVDLATICLRCLDKDPVKRYPTAAALAQDLGRYLLGEPILARPVGRLEQVLKWTARKPMTAAAYSLTAMIAVMLVIGVTISIFWRSAEAARQKTETALDGEKRARAGEKLARKQLDETKSYNQYVLNVRIAPTLWDKGWVNDARDALEACPKHLRQWEWKYLHRKFHPELTTMKGHNLRILNLELSPDEKYLATSRGGVRLWDTVTGDEAAVLSDMRDMGEFVVFSPDGTRLAAGSDNGFTKADEGAGNALVVWDLSRNQKIARFELPDDLCCFAYSADGMRLAAGLRNGTLRLWNATDLTELPVHEKHTQAIERIQFLSHGELVSGSRDGTIKFWNASTGRELVTVPGPARISLLEGSKDGRELVAHYFDGVVKRWKLPTARELASSKIGMQQGQKDIRNNRGGSADLSPDHQRLAAFIINLRKPSSIKIFNVKTGATIHELSGFHGRPTAVKFSPDNQRLATGYESGEICIWDIIHGHQIARHIGHPGPVTIFTFTQDGTRLYSGDMQGTARSWDLTAQPDVDVFTNPVAAISPDGHRTASFSQGGRVRVRKLSTGEELDYQTKHTGGITKLAFHPHSQVLASGGLDGSVQLLNLLRKTEPAVLGRHGSGIGRLEFSLNGDLLASAENNGIIKIWDTNREREISSLQGHTQPVENLAFSSRGDRLASVSRDNVVKLWNLSDGREIFEHRWEVSDTIRWPLAFSLDDSCLASSCNAMLKHLDTETGQTIFSWTAPHTIDSVAVSPNGRLLAFGGWFPGIHVWDLANCRAVTTVGSAEYELMQFSPDGTRLVGTGKDNAIRMWDVSTWTEVAALTGHQLPAHLVRFTPDGKRLITASNDGTVCSWIAEESPQERQERLQDRPRFWRLAELERAVETQDWYAVAFHLGWLLKYQPDDQSLRTRYGEALAKLQEQNIAPP